MYRALYTKRNKLINKIYNYDWRSIIYLIYFYFKIYTYIKSIYESKNFIEIAYYKVIKLKETLILNAFYNTHIVLSAIQKVDVCRIHIFLSVSSKLIGTKITYMKLLGQLISSEKLIGMQKKKKIKALLDTLVGSMFLSKAKYDDKNIRVFLVFINM